MRTHEEIKNIIRNSYLPIKRRLALMEYAEEQEKKDINTDVILTQLEQDLTLTVKQEELLSDLDILQTNAVEGLEKTPTILANQKIITKLRAYITQPDKTLKIVKEKRKELYKCFGKSSTVVMLDKIITEAEGKK